MEYDPARSGMNAKWPALPLQKVTLPQMLGEKWNVVRFEVSEREASFHNLRCAINAGRTATDRRIRPGVYTGLYAAPARSPEQGTPWMSDTPAEMADHAAFVKRAHGAVLITGLGIGLCVHNLLLKRDVTSITIIELDAELCASIGPHYERDPRVRVVHDDAYTWTPARGDHFDFAWHDIWPDICADNIPKMKKLMARFKHSCAKQDAWAYHDCLYAARW